MVCRSVLAVASRPHRSVIDRGRSAVLGLAMALALGGVPAPGAAAATQDQAQPGSPPASPPPGPAPADAPAPMIQGDPFGEPVTLTGQKIIYLKGTGNWGSAFETLVDAFISLRGYLAKAGVQEAGRPMTIYTSTDDAGFTFQAAIPVAELPKDPPRGDLAAGALPEGKALTFTHRGSFDSMDTTYEAITNHLDERQLDARDLFIEEYLTDPTTTPSDKLVVHVIVPIK